MGFRECFRPSIWGCGDNSAKHQGRKQKGETERRHEREQGRKKGMKIEG